MHLAVLVSVACLLTVSCVAAASDGSAVPTAALRTIGPCLFPGGVYRAVCDLVNVGCDIAIGEPCIPDNR